MDYETMEVEIPQAVSEPAAPATPDTSKVLGKISMILGIVALTTQCIGIGTALSLPSAIASLICGFVTKEYAADKALNSNGKIGIVLSFIQIAIAIFNTLAALTIIFLYIIFYFLFVFALLAESGAMYY